MDGRATDRPGRVRRILQRIPRSRAIIALAVLLALVGTVHAARHAILRGLGAFLVTEDALVHADAIVVLGGASLERGAEAARLYRAGWAPAVYCTSGMVPTIYQAENIDRNEAEVTRDVVIRQGVPADRCFAIEQGTSTKEEADAILAHKMDPSVDTLIVVSSRFHLRRVGFVFRRRFAERGITVVLRGAASTQFDEARWWDKEEGLMMCQNEYVKLLYYWWKY